MLSTRNVGGWRRGRLGQRGRALASWCGASILGGLLLGVSHAVRLEAQTAYSVMPIVSPRIDSEVPRAQSTPNNPRLVTLTVPDSSIAYIVRTLVQQANARAVYNYKDPLFAKRVSVHVVKEPIMNALATVLRGTGLTATIAPDGETILIRAQSATDRTGTQGPTGILTGRVTDSASGHGVANATVRIAGTELSAVTTDDGTFALANVPAGKQEVTVRVFGYRATSREVDVADGQRSRVQLILTPIATMLSGVVTTATGVQSRLSVGSDITTINVDSVMQTAPVHTITDLLENRVPGLTVAHTSGTPGDPSRLLLRGAASINAGNNPIVVIDGVRVYDPADLSTNAAGGYASPRPSPLDQIDPNTIETVEVLKGPSASALYGSDAANGVIVITTKKGQSGKTHWSVSANQGVSYIPGSYPTLTYAFGHVVGYNNGGYDGTCIGGEAFNVLNASPCIIDSVRNFQALNNPRFSPLTSGPLSSLSATMSGGAQALTYSFTGSAQNTHGMTKMPGFVVDQYTEAVGAAPPSWMRHPDDYGSWSGSGQVQVTLSPQATVTVSDMLSSSTQHRTTLGLDAVGGLMTVYVDTTNLSNEYIWNTMFTKFTSATLTSTNNATLNWRIRPWLPLQVTAGYNRTQENDTQYLPAGLPLTILSIGGDTDGFYGLGTSQANVATLNANTTIPVTFSRSRTLQLALGTNFVSQSTALQSINTSVVPIGVSDPTTFPQTTGTNVAQQTQGSATYGWFFEPQLQLQSRLYITPGIRLDGGTASGSSAGLSAFPKTNVSYIALDRTGQTDETGWSQALSLLRLRGAFGIAGVEPTPGQSLRLFGTPSVVSTDGGSVSTTATPVTTLGNPLLHPERSREWEAGFDVQFFQNRASLTATYYDKLRIDAIMSEPIAPSVFGMSGTTAVTTYTNVGNIRNTGVELTANATVLDRGAVTWNINGTFSTNDNRVQSAAAGYTQGCSSVIGRDLAYTCLKPGYPVGAVFSKSIVGYGDVNQDGVIEPNEVFYSDSARYVGGPDPRYSTTFSTNVSLWHGRLSVSAQGDYQSGVTVVENAVNTLLESAANQPNASIEDQVLGIGAWAQTNNNFGAQRVSQFRVDGVSMNVVLPLAVAHAFRAQQAMLALQGSNLGLWTTYVGKDAGVGAALNGLENYDSGQLPLPRTWQLSVRITQ